ncbi:hypothetical protein CPB83DRAFT_841483 [Crepidotus variabilis]|uniref:Chromo domain-containing protein n=1 Tax=Crepidotus variabilis TaxID=179855 RepID=A0A9P6JWN0_9AGAR|nr:hypothetical protein CPB83DRAFT_841483 [Crepidotus variabilis]
MSDEEEEYEVESVQEARVEKAPGQGRAKNPKLVWKYRVRWKNYGPSDDTWEPLASFNDSEHIVTAFWQRANTGGRDVEDLTQFTLGENFLPLGPPRKKLKRKTTADEPIDQLSTQSIQEVLPSAQPESAPEPRELSPEADISSRPNKRRRGTGEKPTEATPISASVPTSATPQRRSNRNRPSSPEVVPDSDEEMSGAVLQTYLTPQSQKRKAQDAEDTVEIVDAPEPHDPLFDAPENVPEHVARKENPLVNMVDDPALTPLEGGISTKTRAASKRQISSQVASTSKKVKPGPGRSSSGIIKNKSSLLTAEKGALKSVKGRYRKEDRVVASEEVEVVAVMAPSKPPPTAEELLDLAGLDANASELPDFEEENNDDKGEEAEVAKQAMAVEPPTPIVEISTGPSASPITSFPGHSLFSQATVAPSPGLLSKWGSSFNRSSIFGPLSLGFNHGSESSSSSSSRIYLNLDSSVSIPALLVNTTNTEIENLAPQMGSKETPGKFYSSEAALTLLGTVRAGGVAAQVALDENSTSEDKVHFKHFIERLQNGDLFVAVAGIHILVFCSAGNTVLSQRLNIPPALHNITEAIVVAQVTVENYSGYADATSNADERRWIQYVTAAF